jgi:hypothetical protein
MGKGNGRQMSANEFHNLMSMVAKIDDNLSDLRVEVADLRGDVKEIRAQKPCYDEVREIVDTAVQNCHERGRDTGNHKRPIAVDYSGLMLRVMIGVVTIAAAAMGVNLLQ